MSTNDMKRYTYNILRYCHDPIRGEFVNIGLAMFCEGQFGFRFNLPIKKLNSMFPTIDFDLLNVTAHTLRDALFEADINVYCVEDITLNVLPQNDNSLYWAVQGYGVTENFDGSFNELMKRFVL